MAKKKRQASRRKSAWIKCGRCLDWYRRDGQHRCPM